MSTPGESERTEAAAIEAEAIAWLAERDEGFAPGRAAAFEAWRRRGPRHTAVIAELEQVLAQLDGLAERREEVNAYFHRTSPLRAEPVVSAAVPPLRGWRPWAWGGLAAALALGAWVGFRPTRPAVAPDVRYVTTAAGYERARLEDGSMLELNGASAVRVRYTATERRVELDAGEAHFEVAHDTSRPFVVSAAGVAVRAVGTAFNVRFAPGAVEVTVTEGKVAVGPVGVGAGRGGGIEALTSAPGSTLLGARDRLAIPFAATSAAVRVPVSGIEHLAAADVRAALAWQRRVVDFSDTPLAEVAARFNRHHALQLVVTDPGLGARRIGGIFALDDVEAFVRLLERDGVVRVEREGDIVRLRAP